MLHILDSGSRSSGITPEFTTTFELPKVNINSLELSEIEIPFSYRTIKTGNTAFCKVGSTEINVYGGYNRAHVTTDNNTLYTNFDGRTYTATISPGYYTPAAFCSALQAALAADPYNSSVTVIRDPVNFIISITITRTSNYGAGGLMYPSPMLNLLGITQNNPPTEEQKTNYHGYSVLLDYNRVGDPDNNIYKITATKVMEFTSYNVTSELSYYTNQILSNYGITISATVDATNTVILTSLSTITINITDQSNPFHWMAYELGFRSNKSGTSVTADVPLKIPFRYPRYYYNYLSFTYNDLGTLNVQIPDGNYTIYDLCTTLKNNIIAANPAISNATVTCSRNTYLITVTITSSSTSPSVILAGYADGTEYNNYPYSSYLGNQLGLISSITNNPSGGTVSFTFQRSINLSGPDALYLRSTISRTHEATGFYKADDVVIRVPIPTNPNRLIIYRPENEQKILITEDTTIVSITTSLTYEDGQLVDLNGHEWSYNVCFNY